MAKVWTTEVCGRLVLLAHQVHGAIGFTLDHDLQLYTRRIEAAEGTFGDAHFHKEKVAEAMERDYDNWYIYLISTNH